MVRSFKAVLEDIKTMKRFKDDSLDSDDEIIDNIVNLANEMLDTLQEMEGKARDKQYDCVQAFLKIYWGEDTEEARKARGSNLTLKDIMDAGSSDIGLFDRILYAATQTSDVMMNLIAESVRREKATRNQVMLAYRNEIQSIT